MVTSENQDTRRRRLAQGPKGPLQEANKINACTPYEFEGKNLTA
jgi:hypothetical protein